MLRDTWKPKVFGGSPSHQASINHGTYFYHASQEGLLANDSNIHAGIRTTLSGPSDYENDGYCGFEIVEAREIDTIGMHGIIRKIKERVGTTKPVYLSIDIDTLDPACELHAFLFLFLIPVSRRACDLQVPCSLRTVLVSLHPGPRCFGLPLTTCLVCSCASHRHTGDRWMVHERASHDYQRAGRHQSHRCRHCRGCTCIRHERRAYHNGSSRCAVRSDDAHG